MLLLLLVSGRNGGVSATCRCLLLMLLPFHHVWVKQLGLLPEC